MPGFTETLIIIAIILAIIVLPKRFGRKPEPVIKRIKKRIKLTGWTRIAILSSILWLAFSTLYLTPWNNGWTFYIYAGPGPVALFWGIFWIILGFKKMGK